MARSNAELADVLFGTPSDTSPAAADLEEPVEPLEDSQADDTSETQKPMRRSVADVLFGDAITEPADGDQDDLATNQADDQQPVVPDDYELELPAHSPFDQADLDALSTMARDRQWTQEQAQAALGQMHDVLATQVLAFKTELEADRELGGRQLETTLRVGREVLDRLLPESEPDGARLRAALVKNGADYWQPFARLLVRVARALGEDRRQGR